MKKYQHFPKLRESNINKFSFINNNNLLVISITPVLNIVSTFLNENNLYSSVVELPETMNFMGLVTTLALHPKFKYLEGI